MGTLTLLEQQYLRRKKTLLIDGCTKCGGVDLSCSCYQSYLMEVGKVVSNIPPKYRDFNLQDIDEPSAKKLVSTISSYISTLPTQLEKGRGILLWGGTGNAKTTLACIILMQALRQGYTAYFTDLSRCMDLMAEGWTDDEAKAEFEKRILNSQFLVLDDIGREYKGRADFLTAHVDQIFRERTNNLLPTILTSNLAPKDIASDFGKRLLSILYEHLVVIETNAPDYRRVLAQQNEQDLKETEKAIKKATTPSGNK